MNKVYTDFFVTKKLLYLNSSDGISVITMYKCFSYEPNYSLKEVKLFCSFDDKWKSLVHKCYFNLKKEVHKPRMVWLSGLGVPSGNQKVACEVPGQGTRLGCEPDPHLGRGACERQLIDD